jgi:predicted nucleic acid-binding protein
MICIDASVFVAAARPSEAQHAESQAFLQAVQVTAEALCVPVLVLPECAAAIARRTQNPDLGMRLVRLIERFPGLQLIPLSGGLAHRGADVAAVHQLRGVDAVYVAVAEALRATLVTWDAEMLGRGSTVVDTATPATWLQARPAP